MDVHKIIGKLPRPKKGFVLPGHKYTGPYNPLDKQLDEYDQPLPGEEPFNAVDTISMKHDICYRDNNDKKGKHKCDDEMLHELEWLKPKDLRERIDRRLVQKIIGTKRRMGWGIQWSSELADELHKPIIHKFQKRKVVAKNVDDIWSADLVEMIPYARVNKGFKYLLMVIDVFSKYGWIVPLKTKTGAAITEAFKKLFKEKIPTRLWTDKGSEFYNKTFKELLAKKNIILYSTHNEEKAFVVERWNRTMKRNMWKYFTANHTKKYLDILPTLVDKYNNTYHRSIKCTPKEARDSTRWSSVHEALYGDTSELAKTPKFHVDDKVRITRKKTMFEKGFTPNWTDKVYIISQVKKTKPPTYVIKDDRGEEVQGSFYEQELQKTKTSIYRIERVLKKRTKADGQKEEFVKWTGYDNSYNSWIPITNLEKHGNK